MFLINNRSWILLLSRICLARAFDVFVVPDQVLDFELSTEFPTEPVPTSTEDLSEFEDITLEVGEYTTIIYQFENEQYMGMDDPEERCFNDYTKCLTSMISGIRPVCAFQSQYNKPHSLRTFRTTCDMHVDNCYMKHRHWRVLDYGLCIDVKPYEKYYYGPWLSKNFDVINT